jgi:hypothetical protein
LFPSNSVSDSITRVVIQLGTTSMSVQPVTERCSTRLGILVSCKVTCMVQVYSHRSVVLLDDFVAYFRCCCQATGSCLEHTTSMALYVLNGHSHYSFLRSGSCFDLYAAISVDGFASPNPRGVINRSSGLQGLGTKSCFI